MTIHFICMGNTYRSRLAEAYLKSLEIKGFEVISSGVDAQRNYNGPIARYAKALLAHYRITKYGKSHWDQLTQECLDKSDVVVCLNRLVYVKARKNFRLPDRTLVWDVADINQMYLHPASGQPDEHLLQELAQRTYIQIRDRVDELVMLLKKTAKHRGDVDVLHPDGGPAGYTAALSQANNRGLWHAGVHATLYTEDGQVLIEQRSKTILTNPGLWEVTLGGVVDAGETPDEAIVREVHEELGLKVGSFAMTKIGVLRANHYLPSYGFHSRVMLHSYIGRLPKKLHVKLQSSEVQDWRLLPIRKLRQQLDKHDPRTELIHYPSLHKQALDAVEAALTSVSLH